MDEFTDMVKLEFLDLSRNVTIQYLPSMSGATSLKNMVLDGCVGLKRVEGLPVSLESFSLDAGSGKDDCKKAKITHITMAGCAKLSDFVLRGSLPKLEELNLSHTSVKTLDLKDEVVEVPCLQRIIMMGCEQLRAVLWPKMGVPGLTLLVIDNRGGEKVERTLPDLDKLKKGHHHVYVATMDMRFIQSLVIRSHRIFLSPKTVGCSLNLCISAGSQWCSNEKMGPDSISGPPLAMSLFPNHSYNTYNDFAVDDINIGHDYSSAVQFQLGDYHVEIGDGFSNTSVDTIRGMEAIILVMDKAGSLHVHDNSSITSANPGNIPGLMKSGQVLKLGWDCLKWCRVERCTKLHTVFDANHVYCSFKELESIWAADLPMACCIWSSEGSARYYPSRRHRYGKLQSIHLHSCPRLTFILPLSWLDTLRNLETIHIVFCGDLKVVFPVEQKLDLSISTYTPRAFIIGTLEFPNLKHVYLHDLHKLQHICEAKIFAPKLETIRVRGCWGLRRLPAIGRDNHPVVDCEKDWWDKLEWDGQEAGHHPNLFKTHHPSYYKMPLERISVLR
ncbi:hypothetical protein CFC21_104827 [Triticum aestivum]|uniref:Disease resistance protein At4g27190-like leucine-rich repeats domain-containing protein n=2 Tax=Triticum aestivum TaxID=4565 RepID=A0A9R1MAY1_WHEAT|nr:uncharacterized protein LOC119340467 [Triticum dicoccoides]KAF7103894.1 hypothetical protein CFC21_104827 [Triticum aestivum]